MLGESDPAVSQELFHQSYSQCDHCELQDDIHCHTCQHLRLKHLIKCLPYKIRDRYFFPLRKGLIEDSGITRCPLCRIVKHVVLSNYDRSELSDIGDRGYDLKIYLQFFQAQETSVKAVITLEFLVGEGPRVQKWKPYAGTLHIDDTKNGKCPTQYYTLLTVQSSITPSLR